MARGKEKWEPQLQGFIKLNYDGVSKGNMRQSRAGGLFKDSTQNIMYGYIIWLGLNSKNGAKHSGLLMGMRMTKVLQYKALIVEGDSKITTEGLRKIINDTDPERVSYDWQLSYGYTEIARDIRGNFVVISSHVKRKGNAMEDHLENVAVHQSPRMDKWSWNDVGQGPLRDMILRLVEANSQGRN
jgi:ribonuclease HI